MNISIDWLIYFRYLNTLELRGIGIWLNSASKLEIINLVTKDVRTSGIASNNTSRISSAEGLGVDNESSLLSPSSNDDSASFESNEYDLFLPSIWPRRFDWILLMTFSLEIASAITRAWLVSATGSSSSSWCISWTTSRLYLPDICLVFNIVILMECRNYRSYWSSGPTILESQVEERMTTSAMRICLVTQIYE